MSPLILRKRSPGWSWLDWLKHTAISWNWETVGENRVRIGHYVLETTPYYFEILWREWYSWKNWYLPSWSLKGKTVLDVGAGCGETALFYFRHGAKRVIAVEPQQSLIPLLKENMTTNRWDMQIVDRPFDTSMLGWSFEFMKMDGEGCETQLLDMTSVPPCAIEVHDMAVAENLGSRFGMKILPQKENWILQNFDEKQGTTSDVRNASLTEGPNSRAP